MSFVVKQEITMFMTLTTIITCMHPCYLHDQYYSTMSCIFHETLLAWLHNIVCNSFCPNISSGVHNIDRYTQGLIVCNLAPGKIQT